MNVPKKILFVGSFPPPFGGIASHLSDLFETYKKENEHFYIYDLDKNINKKDEGLFHFRSLDKLGNILLNPIYIFTFFKNIKGFYFSITFLMSFIVKGSIGVKAFLKILLNLIRLINTVKEFKISVISTYHIFPEGIYPYLLKKNFFPDLKYSITVFGELQADTVEIDKYKKVYTDILQNADLVMASSQYCANGVAKVNFSPDLVKVIYYGINLDHYKRELEYAETSRENTIIFVGHINKRMGLESLLAAMEILKNEKKINAIARIIGNDHGYLKEFEEMISKKGLNNNIKIYQKVSDDELKGFYNSSYMYVNTANTKLPCMGLSMKEAMAIELPVVASNAGGIPEAVIQNKTGFVFEADNYKQLAHYIEILYNDFQLAKEFGKEGNKRALQVFDGYKSSQKIISLLKQI